MPTSVGFEVQPSTAQTADPFHADNLTIDQLTALVQRVKLVWGAPGSGQDVSASAPLPVAPQGSGDLASALSNGRRTVGTPGTAVALASNTPCKWVTITALPANTSQVNVGGSGVVAGAGSDTGTPLQARDSVTVPVSNANLVFVDAQVSGEGVSFMVGA